MKKLLFFLITALSLNMFIFTNVKADSFYEGNYIDGIYMNKEKGGTRYYQKARFFNQNGTLREAYCIEPFAMFDPDGYYQESLTADNLSQEQMEHIQKVIHFGYKYSGHTDVKWYAITQFMVWKIADPNALYYFTNGLDGPKIDVYQSEMDEINRLVAEYDKIPSINLSDIHLVEDEEIVLTDTNGVLSKYKSKNNSITINSNNTLSIHGLKEGNYNIELVKQDGNSLFIPVFYNSSTSQNMALKGDLKYNKISLNIHVHKTSLEISKIDADTKTTKPSGEANLLGAIYELYDKDMNKISELPIDDNFKASVSNLSFGKYFIKEKKAGVGYQLDKKTYEFTIDQNHLIASLTLENKVVEKEVQIHKNYGEENNFQDEEGVHFNVYNHKNDLINTIVTNDKGIASIILPFGKYLFSQLNTSEGYQKVSDFRVEVMDNKLEKVELYDFVIKVPDTEVHEEKIEEVKEDEVEVPDNNTVIDVEEEIPIIIEEKYDYQIKVPNTRVNNYSILLFVLLGLIYVKKRLFA